jgi:hypothetical protein
LFRGQFSPSKYASRNDFAALEMMDMTATCPNVFPVPSSALSTRAAGEGPQLTLVAGLFWALSAMSAAVVTMAVVWTLALMLEGGRNVVSNNAAAATVAAAVSVADSGIDNDPTGASRSDDAASSMLEKGKRNKNRTNNIGIQAFNAVLQLGVGYWLIASLLSCDVWGPSTCLIHLR